MSDDASYFAIGETINAVLPEGYTFVLLVLDKEDHPERIIASSNADVAVGALKGVVDAIAEREAGD